MSDFRMGSAFVEVHARDSTDADVQRIIAKVSGRKASIKVDADANGLRKVEAQVGSSVSGILGSLRMVPPAAQAALAALAGGGIGAGIAALPGVAAAGASALGVLGLSFSGVGDAISAYKADQDAASASGIKAAGVAASNARAIRNAQSSIDDARRNAARVARSGSETIAAASHQVEQALEAEKRAQDDLTDARRDATRSLEDLREVVSDYALDEDQAAQAVAEAKVRLKSANTDVFTSDLQRKGAALDLRSAEERLSDIQRERAEKTAELAEAEKKGVDGSSQVVAAQERLQDAHESVTEAKASETKAVRDAGEANEDAARAVAEAVLSLKDVQAQQAEAASVATVANSKYRDELAKLNPAQRELVEQLIRMGPLVTGLKNTASGAFLPGVTSMLKDSEGLFPIFNDALKRSGGIMGDTARKFGEMFKTPEFKSNLEEIFKGSDPILRGIGDLLLSVTDDAVGFGAKMAPVGEHIQGFLDKVGLGMDGFFENLGQHEEGASKFFDQLGILAQWALPALGSALGVAVDASAWLIEKLNQTKDKALEFWHALDRVAAWPDETGQYLRRKFDELMNWIGNKITSTKDWVVGKARDLVNGIVDWFSGLPGRAGDAFARTRDAIGRAFDGIMEKTKAPIRWVIDVVYNNGIRGLWDKVRGVFGGDPMPYFMPFARGGLVPGMDRGYDYVPAMLRGGEGVLVPEAVSMLGGAQGIERLNRMGERQGFASGGVAGYHGSGSASITKTTGSVQASSSLSSMLSSPIEWIKSLFGGILGDAGKTPGSGSLRDALVSLPMKLMNTLLDKAKSLFSSGAAPVGSGVQRWSGLVLQALSMMGEPAGLLNVVLRRMNQESGGNPRAINLWDSNAKKGIPSKGLMQTIDPTFMAYHFPGTSYDVYDPLANVLASMRYAKSRYGSLSAAYNKAGGYDSGGLAQGVGMLPKYTPEPERVLSPDQTRAFERLVDHLTAGGGAYGDRPVVVNVQQTSGSPAETGRFVALSLRSI